MQLLSADCIFSADFSCHLSAESRLAEIILLNTAQATTPMQIQWLIDHPDVSATFAKWLGDFDHHYDDIGLMKRILEFRMTHDENDVSAAQTFLAAEVEHTLQAYGLSLPDHINDWTPDFWEILWDVLKEVAPELLPGIDTAVELKNAIESASNGDWWQSAWHFVGAALTLTPWDKIKDSYKFARAIGRANRWFDLIKRCSGYNDEMARGLRNILKKELSNPHIFRKAPGHLPDLQPAINAAGGADNLLFDAYKKVHDSGIATSLILNGPEQTVDIFLHGVQLRATVIKNVDQNTGMARVIISNLWKPGV